MCRGCALTKDSKNPMIDSGAYLDTVWWPYEKVIYDMKALNKNILEFEDKLTVKNKKILAKFRYKLIRLQKEYAKANIILSEVYETKESN